MIRKASPSDLEAILELWQQMSRLHEQLDDSFKLKEGAVDTYKLYAKKVIEDSNILSVVFDDGSVIGYLFAEIFSQPPVYHNEKIGMITEICVDKRYRRDGVGNDLLKHAEKWITDQDVTIIDCQVASMNPISRNFG
jgi:ribosomal protein S18 acetylase RimI-like enzyme